MKNLNKLATGLVVVFAVSLLVLVVEILYVLWRRRRVISIAGGDVESGGDSFNTTPSKELLYFFCWKDQTSTRIEPHAATTVIAPPLPSPVTDAEMEEMMKWQQQQEGLYGPSRLLFTIKEEDREEMMMMMMESENESNNKKGKKESVCLQQEEEEEEEEEEVAVAGGGDAVVVVLEEEEVAVAVGGGAVVVVLDDVNEVTPFSTPCASPPYYTPSHSPPHDGCSSHSSGDENGIVLLA